MGLFVLVFLFQLFSQLVPVAARESPEPLRVDNRSAVRRQSFIEMQIFSQRWNDAVKNAKCWIDLYKETDQQSNA